MAVVSRPIKHSRRIALPGGVRPAPSWWTTALIYILLLVLGYLLITPIIGWGQRRLDDMRYGFPRTTQIDGFVGHGEQGGIPTHLIALNLQRQVSILEIPGGDTGKVRALVGPYLVGADGENVTPFLSLQDMNGDGQTDLLLQVREEIVVYINDTGSFRLITPAERARLVPPEERGAK
ncbi:MAG TPA: VCBS repeat-containing protein [Roseiflexaceae bacterium]|nr:VCBS repeat-containing protein [Roseiflexaceae bacterium]